jgi:uncharacterized protein
MKYFFKTLAPVILSFCFTSTLYAFNFPDTPTAPVSDYAHVIDNETKDALTQEIRALEASTTDQVAVVTIPSLDGADINEESVNLFRTWGIGQKDKNNGVLFLIAIQDKKMRIEVGYGLEGDIPDVSAFRITEYEVKPLFKEGKYSEGIKKGVDDIVGILGGSIASTTFNENYQNTNVPNASDNVYHIKNGYGITIFFLTIFTIFFFMILPFFRGVKTISKNESNLHDISASEIAEYVEKIKKEQKKKTPFPKSLNELIALFKDKYGKYKGNAIKSLCQSILLGAMCSIFVFFFLQIFLYPFTEFSILAIVWLALSTLIHVQALRTVSEKSSGFNNGGGGFGTSSSSSDWSSSSSDSDSFGGGSSGGGGAGSSW